MIEAQGKTEFGEGQSVLSQFLCGTAERLSRKDLPRHLSQDHLEGQRLPLFQGVLLGKDQ